MELRPNYYACEAADQVFDLGRALGTPKGGWNRIESKKLAQRAKGGDEYARLLLVASVAGLAMRGARRFVWSRIPLDDLFQSAMAGVCVAVNRFDGERGVKFATYAEWWIRSSLQRYVYAYASLIQIPIHKRSELQELLRFCDERLADDGVMPNATAIAEHFGVSVEKANEWEAVAACGRVQSMHSAYRHSGKHFLLEPEAPEGGELSWETLERAERILFVRKCLLALDERRRTILIERASGKTLLEVGKQFKVTRERIRQLEASAMQQLAMEMKKFGPEMSLSASLRDTG